MLAAALATAACSNAERTSSTAAPSRSSSSPVAAAPEQHPRGGSARVGIYEEPDPGAATLAAAAVRALVLPQLFIASPDGTWTPSLVSPGSDADGPGLRSASFVLRPEARWSDGTPITTEDLRRSADLRVVAGVDGPGAAGRVTVRFTQVLPNWRRLWSGSDSVAAPRAGVWGGPFVLASYERGLQAVLARNPGWYGGPGPFLDEVRLVLVPDATTARQLFARGELDVVMPLAATQRTPQLRAVAGASVDVGRPGGWWEGLLVNANRLRDKADRKAVLATVDRDVFVRALLQGEADPVRSFVASGATWRVSRSGNVRALANGPTVDFVGMTDDPVAPLLQKAMQRRARKVDGTLELRNAEADRVEGWVARNQYQVALVPTWDPPGLCWVCRFGAMDAATAKAADAGDREAALRIERRLRDDGRLLPLWRSRAVVAWRGTLRGPKANGWALSGAWNAAEWWREP